MILDTSIYELKTVICEKVELQHAFCFLFNLVSPHNRAYNEKTCSLRYFNTSS